MKLKKWKGGQEEEKINEKWEICGEQIGNNKRIV